jgi:hypothetical protein
MVTPVTANTLYVSCNCHAGPSFFLFVGWSGTESPTGVLYRPRMIHDECGAAGEMIGRGNQSTRGKPAPVPLCPPQIPHDLTQA